MKSLKWRSRCLLAVFPLLPAAAAGQTPGPDSVPRTSRVPLGSIVRVESSIGRPLIGSFTTAGDGRLGVRSPTGHVDTLRLDQVSGLSIRGRHTGTGAIIGGSLGAAFGAFIGVIITATCETDGCDGVRPYLLSIPAFGAGGALLGAAVGAAFPRWRRVLP